MFDHDRLNGAFKRGNGAYGRKQNGACVEIEYDENDAEYHNKSVFTCAHYYHGDSADQEQGGKRA